MKEKLLQNNLAYILDDNRDFSEMEYRIVQNLSSQVGLADCAAYKMNGHMALLYQTGVYKRLDILLNHLEPDHILAIVSKLFTHIANIRENGFLNSSKIIYDLGHIFIDVKTDSPYLLYLPVLNNSDFFECQEYDFRSNLIRKLQQSFPEPGTPEKIRKLMNVLSNTILSSDEAAAKIRCMVGGSAVPHPAGSDVGKEFLEQSSAARTLRIMNKESGREIVLRQKGIILGRQSPDENGTICPKNHKSVGRQHCEILYQKGNYYLKDLGSINGTWLNGMKLKNNKIERLKDGMDLRIANLSFSVIVREEE